MQIAERETGAVTVLDLSGKITLGEGDTQLKDKLQQPPAPGKEERTVQPGGGELRRQRWVGRAGQRIYDSYPRGRQPEAAQRHPQAAGSAVDHQAVDRLRDVRFGGRGDQKLQERNTTRRRKDAGEHSSKRFLCCFLSLRRVFSYPFRKITILFVFVPFELLRTPQQFAVLVNC